MVLTFVSPFCEPSAAEVSIEKLPIVSTSHFSKKVKIVSLVTLENFLGLAALCMLHGR